MSGPKGSSRRWWLAAVLPPVFLMVLIAVLSHQTLPIGLHRGSDKLVHGLVYALLGWLWCRALFRGRFGWVACMGLAFGISSVWGLLDEWHQSFVPGRMAEAMDAVADIMGAAAGSVLAVVVAGSRGKLRAEGATASGGRLRQ